MQHHTTTTTGATTQEWMSTREAADYLGVSIKTTRRWAQEILSGKVVRPMAGGELSEATRSNNGRYQIVLRGLSISTESTLNVG